MSRKRVSSEQMAELLNEPHFAPAADRQQVSTDPINPTPMLLDVDQVRPYDHNPRKTPNSEYQAIYESIQANGLDQVLTITRRPGESHYMVFAGGNTRLEIIQKLWRETGDVKYQKANFLFRPWSSDLETLLAHLRENDQRGDLTFIDRAHALVELRQMLEQELGLTVQEEAKPAESDKQESCQGGVCHWHTSVGTETADSTLLSNRRFAEILKERGYSIRRESLHLYWYTVEELAAWIPGILKQGAGRPLIEEIYRIDKVFMDTWRFLKLEPEEEARMIFHTLIQRMDGEGEIDTDLLWSQLKKELSVCSDQTLNTCGMLMMRIAEKGTADLDWFWEKDAEEREREAAKLQQAETTQTADEPVIPPADDFALEPWEPGGSRYQLPEALPEDEDELDEDDGFFDTSATPISRQNLDLPLDEESDPADDQPLQREEARKVVDDALESVRERFRDGNSNYSYSLAEMLSLPLPAMPDSLPELRQRLCSIAQELFSRAGLHSGLIHSIPTGVGFIVLPITNQAAAGLDATNPHDRRWLFALHLWSELADFSQQFMFGSPAHRYVPDGFRSAFPAYLKALENAETDEQLFASYGPQDWAELSNGVPYMSGWHGRESRTYRLFADSDLMGQQSLALYMQLIDTYRALHRVVQGNVWRDAP